MLLTFDQVSHHFGSRAIFHNINLTLSEPRVLLTGANGSGKTTLLLMAAGVLVPTQGRVQFNRHSVAQPAMHQQVGISASKVNLPGFFTVTEMLAFHARQFDCSAQNEWITTFALTPYLNTLVQDLSLGNYKKLSLIVALMHKPALLLLDEPTNGLDSGARTALEACIADYDGQVVIASHEAGVLTGENGVRHLHLDANGVHEV